MAEITITREDQPTRGRYVARAAGIDAEAELTYSRSSPKLIIADHTEVPGAFRGQGVGVKLVERLVADARAGDYKIFALCPFVKAQWQKHSEWNDVFQS
ncbi:GNAT family N-acetyltransferase [Leptospira interrogans]